MCATWLRRRFPESQRRSGSVGRADALKALSPIAAEQGGLVSAAQVVLAGVTRNQLSDLAADGDLRHLRRGVYCLGPAATDAELEDIASAWLAIAGRSLPWQRTGAPDAVVSHRSAAQLLGFGTTIADLPELTQARQRSRRTDMVIHPARLGSDDWTWRQIDSGMHLPVTTPARTIVDLLLDGESVGEVEGALRRAFADPQAARPDLLAALSRRRKPGAKQQAWAERTLTEMTAA
jgi:predicted transcriptional regulator of viral defense system